MAVAALADCIPPISSMEYTIKVAVYNYNVNFEKNPLNIFLQF